MTSTPNTLIVSASTKHLRISAYKLRRVGNVIRGKAVGECKSLLRALPHKGARLIEKVLNAAIANAEHNFGLNSQELSLTTLMINEGPQMKRFQPRARGRIYKIIKRTAHINLSLSKRASRTGGSR